MGNIIFLKPVFKEMIWGGDKLATDFGYDIPSEKTGECWTISAHENGDCEILNPEFRGHTLSTLWETRRDLFGNAKGDVFPLLVKFIDAKDDLSVQVHPDDEYAKAHENGSLGKTECWYILDCDENADIIIGHNAKSKEELNSMVKDGRWDDLLRKLSIKKGDFFQINPGCVHAIRSGTVILETQQNSDITYRLYDYDRLSDGKARVLHTEKALDVISVGADAVDAIQTNEAANASFRRVLVSCDYYTVERVAIKDSFTIDQTHKFMNVSAIGGFGSVDGTKISKGANFILPSGYGKATFSGDLELIISYID